MVSEEILAGMRATNDYFCSTIIAQRDAELLDRVYTPDARVLPPGADMIHGLAAIKKFWLEAITRLDVASTSLTTVFAELAGETVVEIGKAELTLTGGQVVPVKYVVHWKHHEGVWKWHIDIWNTNS